LAEAANVGGRVVVGWGVRAAGVFVAVWAAGATVVVWAGDLGVASGTVGGAAGVVVAARAAGGTVGRRA
jgi:hypothetical protein